MAQHDLPPDARHFPDMEKLRETPPADRPVTPWTLDDGRVIHLIHEDDWPAVPDGTVLTDIFGETAVKGRDKIEDMETRSGLLAWGILQ